MTSARAPFQGHAGILRGSPDRRPGYLGLCLILSTVSCEYNADLSVRIPRWETATSPVGVLAVHPRNPSSPPDGPFSAEECTGRPDQVVISFFLANERNQPVGEGGRIRVGSETMHVEAARLRDPADPSQSIVLGQLSLHGETESIPLSADLLDLRYRAAPSGSARLVLLHDHGREAGERDSADERIVAFSEVMLDALCQPEPALGCLLPSDTRISLYRLGGGAAVPLLQRSRNVLAIEGALDDLRHAGEMGIAPYFFLADGVRPGGIPLGLAECDGSDASSRCWPALFLAAGADPTTDPAIASDDLPDGARLFAAGLVDRPDLRRLACQTGGFFSQVAKPADLRLLANRSTTEIPDYDYGYARRALMALTGQWEATLAITGLPSNYDSSALVELSGTLSITLSDQTAFSEFRVTLGGY